MTDLAHPDSVLFITLDSCRYDTFVDAQTPNLGRVGPLHRAMAPSHFTYGSHAAMFVGFTPSLPGAAQPFLDNKFAKLFKLDGPGFAASKNSGFDLTGRSIVDGFGRLGYRTLGSGAVRWFDPSTAPGVHLTQDFAAFHYAGNTWRLREQLDWLAARFGETSGEMGGQREFVFLNVGETHAPYYHEGAPWAASDNPCRPYQREDRSQACRDRQRSALEYADGLLGPLLARFEGATILACADHGECWGEDGLWEHGVSHAMTLTVPLLMRRRGEPVCRAAPRSGVS